MDQERAAAALERFFRSSENQKDREIQRQD
jgi:hypothetical protein